MTREVLDFAQLLSKFLETKIFSIFTTVELQFIREWFSDLASADVTSCVAYGFILECLNNKHPNFTLQIPLFLKQISLAKEIAPNVKPIPLMGLVLNSAYTASGIMNNKFYFLGEQIGIDLSVSKVTTSEGYISMLSPMLPPRLSSSSIRRQAIKGLLNPIMKGIKSRSPFWFVAKTDEAREILHSNPYQQGAALRNRFGLYRYREYHGELVMFSYTVHGVFLYSPTVFDAQGYEVFRPTSRPGWGTTVNLSGFGSGVPEGIHAPLLLGDKANCEAWVNIDADTSVFDWNLLKEYYLNSIQNALP